MINLLSCYPVIGNNNHNPHHQHPPYNMKDTVLLVVSLASLALIPWKVTASRVSGLVDQVINVTVVVDDLGFDVSEKLFCEASVPYIKFIEDNSEQDSLLGIIIIYTQS